MATEQSPLSFGDFVKQKRLALKLSLREFCIKHEHDASNWSKLERGRLHPPQGDKLKEYGRDLGIAEGSDDWHTFVDLAAVALRKIPEDLTEPELLAKLPVFFRTLRDSAKDGGNDTDELLNELKRKIRDA